MSIPSVWPCLYYREPRAALRFLVDVFGFTERAVHGDGDEVHHAELTWNGGGVMVGTAGATADACGVAGVGSVHVVVPDPDERYARAVAAGFEVVRKLEDTDFGSRQFVVTDPEGNTWSFGTWYEPTEVR